MQYRFKEYELDTQKKILTKSGVDQNVTSQIYLLLEVLITHKNQILSKKDLIEKVWDGRIVSPRSIDSQIRSARAAIGDNGVDQKYIKTFNNRGISFIAQVEEIEDHGVQIEQVSTTDHAPSYFRGFTPLFAVGLLLLAVGIFYGASNWVSSKSANSAETVLPSDNKHSVLFIPLDTFNSSERSEVLARNVFSELKKSFETSHDIKIISISHLSDNKVDPEQLNEFTQEFNISYVVSGYLVEENNIYKITLELTNAKTGEALWTSTQDFALNSDYDYVLRSRFIRMSTSFISDYIGIPVPNSSTMSYDPKAYSLYLEARELIALNSVKTFHQGTELYKQALVIDKNFMPAHVELATSYLYGIQVYGLDYNSYFARAEHHLQTARMLDPEDPRLLYAEGRYAKFLSDNKLALEYFNKAIEVSPNYVASYYMRAMTLIDLGLKSEAEATYESVLKYNPTEPVVLYNLALVKIDLGKFDEAYMLSDRNYRWNPSDPAALNIIGLSSYWRGDIGEARKYLIEGLIANPDDNYLQYDLLLTQSMLGRTDDLKEYITYPSWKALYSAYQGDKEPAKAVMSGSAELYDRILLGYLIQEYEAVYDDAKLFAEDNRFNNAERQVGFSDITRLVPLIYLYKENGDKDTHILINLLKKIFEDAPEESYTPEAYIGAIALACFEDDIEKAIRLFGQAEAAGIPLLRVEKEPAYAALVSHPEYPSIRERMEIRAKIIIDNTSSN